MIELKNPYYEVKARLLRECRGNVPLDKEAELQELEEKSRVFINDKFNSLVGEADKIEESSKEVVELPSARKQYAELKLLHRRVKDLAKVVGELKIGVLHEIDPRWKNG